MRAVTIIGPSHSGKTTLVEALAGIEGGQKKSLELMGGGRVTTFDFMGDPWAIFEVPGGLDNIPQIGAALAASDAAVLCTPAEADAAVLNAPYLRILEEAGLPTFIFVNGMDAATDRVSEIIAGLQRYCAHGIILRQIPMREGDKVVGAIDLISERAWEFHDGARSSLVELPPEMLEREQEARADLLEHLADYDDHLLEEIIEDQKPPSDELYEVATRVLRHHDLVPALLGSARHDNGVMRLMKSLRHEVPKVSELRERLSLSGDVLAIGCMADNLKHIGKAVLVRALGAGVETGKRLGGDTIGSLTDIDTRTQMPKLASGEVGLAIKSDHLALGAFMSADGFEDMPGWAKPHAPVLQRVIEPVNERDENKLPGAMTRLAEIDLGLEAGQSQESGHLVVGVHGPQHERRIVGKLADGFAIKVESTPVPTALKETIKRSIEKHYRHRKQSGGAGQFADVLLDVKPIAHGTGFTFDEVVKGGAVPKNFIPSVETGARDALAEGPNGHPVVDISVTLKDGKSHSVDSSDFAFRTAGKNAVREALKEAGTTVLQPIMRIEVHVPSIYTGEVVQIVSGLKGQVQGFESHPTASGWDVFHALLANSAVENLAHSLGSGTRGTAWFTSELDHYDPMK